MITPDEVDEEVQKEGRRDTAEQYKEEKGERGKEERKVVVIVGATGSGKSELGVKVAKACNGEIISMDSMQVYVGLDIASNKISFNEMEGIPHHFISIINLHHPSFDVISFCTIAAKTIEEIFGRGKVPILVGGTHYFAYSLLWNTTIDKIELVEDDRRAASSSGVKETTRSVPLSQSSLIGDISVQELKEMEEKIKKRIMSTNETKCKSSYNTREVEVMYVLLSKVDAIMAQKIHAKDYRKIEKSLKVFYTTGQRQSDIIMKQKSNLQPAYSAHILCLTVEKATLDKRIDSRVDKMMQRGLLQEVKDAWNELKRKGVDTSDHTHGVLQAIGLKEFAPLLQKLDSKNGNIKMDNLQQPEHGNGDQDVDGHGAHKMGKTRDATRGVDDQHNLNDKMDGLQIANSGNDGDDMDKEVQECVQSVKLHTRQYSRQQMKWIRKLVDGDGGRVHIPITYLDATDLTQWNQMVYEPALATIMSFLSSSPSSTPSLQNTNLNTTANPPNNNNNYNNNNNSEDNNENNLLRWKKYTCDGCRGKSLNGANEWNQHIKSDAHKKRLKKQRKAASKQ